MKYNLLYDFNKIKIENYEFKIEDVAIKILFTFSDGDFKFSANRELDMKDNVRIDSPYSFGASTCNVIINKAVDQWIMHKLDCNEYEASTNIRTKILKRYIQSSDVYKNICKAMKDMLENYSSRDMIKVVISMTLHRFIDVSSESFDKMVDDMNRIYMIGMFND